MIKTIYRVVVTVPYMVHEHSEYKAKCDKILAHWLAWETNTYSDIQEVVEFESLSDAKAFESQLNSLINELKKAIIKSKDDED